MSPRMEPDFDWGDVTAATPIHDKGDYEVTIKRVRGQAWGKKDKAGNMTGEVTKVIKITPEIVGIYDSKGKLKKEKDGKPIAGLPTEEINLWVSSDGGRRMSKKQLMAIAGYNGDDVEDEKKFDKYVKDAGLDLSLKLEEGEDSKLTYTIGEGYAKLLVGKNVRASMEPESRPVEGGEPILQQKYTRLSPVNAKS